MGFRRRSISGGMILALLLATSCGPGDQPVAGVPRAAPPPPAASPELPPVDATGLARRVRDNLTMPYERLRYEMELVGGSGKVERRVVEFHRAADLAGRDCAYTVFLEPEEIDGFGLMNLRSGTAEPDQFLFVPAAKKVSRILYFSTNRRSSFCGTQFTFEDLEPLRLEDFQFSLGENARVDGRDCYELVSVPVTQFSGYSRVRNWVDAERSLILKTDFHDSSGKQQKSAVNREPFEAAAGHWRARTSEMSNAGDGRKTRMRLLEHSLEPGQIATSPAAVFTLRTLSRGKEG